MTKRSTLKRKADRLWSEIIMARKDCEVCGKAGTNPHHIIGRKNLTLRHDLRNGCLLCFQCHTGNKISAHNDPMWFMNWLHENREADYNYLFGKQRDLTFKVDYEAIIEKLKEVGE